MMENLWENKIYEKIKNSFTAPCLLKETVPKEQISKPLN